MSEVCAVEITLVIWSATTDTAEWIKNKHEQQEYINNNIYWITVSSGELSLENLAHARVVSGLVTHSMFYLFNNLYFEDKQQPNEG